MLDPILQAARALAKAAELAHRLGEFGAPLVAHGELHLLHLALGLADRRLHAGDLRRGLVTLATHAGDVALEAQDVHIRHRPRLDQRAGDLELALGEFEPARGLLTPRPRLGELLLALADLLAGDRDLRVDALAAGLEQAALVGDDGGDVALELG